MNQGSLKKEKKKKTYMCAILKYVLYICNRFTPLGSQVIRSNNNGHSPQWFTSIGFLCQQTLSSALQSGLFQNLSISKNRLVNFSATTVPFFFYSHFIILKIRTTFKIEIISLNKYASITMLLNSTLQENECTHSCIEKM